MTNRDYIMSLSIAEAAAYRDRTMEKWKLLAKAKANAKYREWLSKEFTKEDLE